MTTHPPRRLLLLCALSAVLGLAASLAAWLLIRLIAILTNAALFHRWGTTLPDFAELPIGPGVVLVAMAGGAVVTLLARWCPIIRGHGIPETMEAVLTRQSKVSPRAAVAKPASAALAIGTGGPFGAEGPIIVTGGALGSLIGQALHVSGIGCGLLAILISRGLFAFEELFRRLPIKDVWHPVVGALVWVSLGLFVPRALGVGYDVIDDALAGRLAIATLATLAVGKLVIWWIALASGTSGGTLAPILLISSCSGALVGELLSRAFPGLGLSPGAFALVAMAATFGAAARAPFAAIVFVFELTRDYNAILPLMLATVLADLLGRTLLSHSIMTEKLARRGVTVPSAFHADPLRTTPVRAVMASSDVASDHDISSDDPAVALQPDDTLYTALLRMVEEEVEQLPVAAQGRVIGVCTRADILEGRIRHLGHERLERGWLALRRTRRHVARRRRLRAIRRR